MGQSHKPLRLSKFAQSANAKIAVVSTRSTKKPPTRNSSDTWLASEHHLNPEEWGGDTVMVEVSAKTPGLDTLLDMVLLVADLPGPQSRDRHTCRGPCHRSAHGTGAWSRGKVCWLSTVSYEQACIWWRVWRTVESTNTSGLRRSLDTTGQPVNAGDRDWV